MRKLNWGRVARGVALWIPTILLGALFVLQGLMKLGGLEVWVERFRDYGYPERFYLLIGVLELGGALLLLVPRVAWIGAVTLGLVMLGAAVTHLLQGEMPNVLFTLGLALIFVGIAYVRRPRKRLQAVAASG